MKITIEIDTNEFGDIVLCEAICKELRARHASTSRVALNRVLDNLPIRASNLVKDLMAQGVKIDSLERLRIAILDGQVKGIGKRTVADIQEAIAKEYEQASA